MSPMAKMPGTLVSNVAVSTGTRLFVAGRCPSSATGPSFMVRPKNGSMASQAIFETRVVVALDDGACEPAALAFQRRHLADHQVHLAGGDQRAHLFDAVRRGAEIVAPVQQRHALGDRAAD